MPREPVMHRFYRQLAEQYEWYGRCFSNNGREPIPDWCVKGAAEAREKLKSVTPVTSPPDTAR